MVIGVAIVTLTLHVEVLPQASVAEKLIIDRPALKLPLALPPDPLLVVAHKQEHLQQSMPVVIHQRYHELLHGRVILYHPS